MDDEESSCSCWGVAEIKKKQDDNDDTFVLLILL